MNIILTQNKNKITNMEIVVLKNLKDLKKKTRKRLEDIGFSLKSSDPVFIDAFCYVGIAKLKGEDLKIGLSNAIQKIAKTKFEKLYINIIQNNKELNINDIVEGIVLGSYTFDRYKSKRSDKNLTLSIGISDSKNSKSELALELEKSLSTINSVNLVRDFVNTTPEDFCPETMATHAKKIAKENNLECKVFGEDYLEENGMNAMLAVGRASRHESKLIHLTYKPKNPRGKLVIVGKGLTYDSGGLS